jgi:uncharacterized protein
MLINSLEFAKQSLEIHGKIRASQLPGVSEVLFREGDDAEIGYTLRGTTSSTGRRGLWLELDGQLDLRCQRCLGAVQFDLHGRSWFELVANEAELAELSADEDDDVDYLIADQNFDVEALVSEEVLLGLPYAPKHENVDCAELVGIKTEQKPNPFLVLQGLKGSKLSGE